jgi:hypothetical protein
MHKAVHITVPNQIEFIRIASWAQHERDSCIEYDPNFIALLYVKWPETKSFFLGLKQASVKSSSAQTWAWIKRETIQGVLWRISIQGNIWWLDTQKSSWIEGVSG